MESTPEKNLPAYYLYQVINKAGQDKDFWNTIGAAWENKDGQGFNLTLDAVPLHGRIVMRKPPKKEGEHPEA